MDLVKIGRYIATKRKNIGLTQRQLADKLGKSDKSVSKWERGICLPDVSIYMDICEILGISINEFLAGEDIEAERVKQKSEDTLIQVAQDSSCRQKYLKRIIAALIMILSAFIAASGIAAYNKCMQPQNYIEALSPDSIEMKTAELLSDTGADGAKIFRYYAKDKFKALNIYISEYRSGHRISHKKIAGSAYDNINSAKNGAIVIVPDFEKFLIKLIVTDDNSKFATESTILSGVSERAYFGRSATSIENIVPLEYGTEQGLAAFMYGKNGLQMLDIHDITGENINTDNDYVYYYSVEFVK